MINVTRSGVWAVVLVVTHPAVQTPVPPVVVGQRIQEALTLDAAEAIAMVPQTLDRTIGRNSIRLVIDWTDRVSDAFQRQFYLLSFSQL